MSELAKYMVSKKLTETAKMYVCLDHIGGSGSTSEIKQCGISNGSKGALYWNVASTFGNGGERVARIGSSWKLLPNGTEYLRAQGYISVKPDAGVGNGNRSGKVAKGADDRAEIVIGHGRSPLWKELKEWLRDHYDCKIHEFNSQSVVGVTHTERLQQLIDVADMAFLLMTAEDEAGDDAVRARQNVVHEVGLFQGALGFKNAAVLLEDGCEEFSNIAGLGQIRFPAGDLTPAFEKIRQYMRDAHGRVA